MNNEAIFFFLCGSFPYVKSIVLFTLSMQLGMHIEDFLDCTIDYTVRFPRWFCCSHLLSANKLSQLKASLQSTCAANVCSKWGSFARPFRYHWSLAVLILQSQALLVRYSTFIFVTAFSAKAAGNDIIGIDLGTTNSCVSVMEGKVRSPSKDCTCPFFLSLSFN